MNNFGECFSNNIKSRHASIIDSIPSELKKLGKFKMLTDYETTVLRIIGENDYALKIVRGDGFDDDKWQETKREAEILRRLAHCSHVVRLIDSKLDPQTNVLYLLEEYYEPLNSFVSMTVFDAITVCIQVCEALIQCRDAGIAHLDVKPDNILIDAHHQVRLGDFGVSLSLEEMAANKTRRGTLRYMAPEVFREGKCSEQSDIYAVGLLLYLFFNEGTYQWIDRYARIAYFQRLAGMPFESIRVHDEIDSAVMEIVSKACSFSPQDRPESFESLRDDLLSLKKHLSESAGSLLLMFNFGIMGTTMPITMPSMPTDDRS